MQNQRVRLRPETIDQIVSRFGHVQHRVKNDIYQLMHSVPTLFPAEDVYVNPNGTAQKQILLDGTLPINYQGRIYHIPLNIWIGHTYPHEAPICHVVPTKNMEIKKKHRHVDSAGKCYVPYLSDWRYDTSNLIGLSQSLMKIFGNDPPVYSKPQSQSLVRAPSSSNEPASLPSTLPTPIPSMNLPTSPSTPVVVIPPSSPPSDRGVDQKQKVVQKIHQNLAELRIDGHKIRQKQLQESETFLNRQIASMQACKVKLDNNINILQEKDAEISEWIRQNENRDYDVDQAVQPADPLSRQMFDLVAQDSAIEDALYYLQEALLKNQMDLETYMKQVRLLSREQFIIRATCKKIFESQRLLSPV